MKLFLITCPDCIVMNLFAAASSKLIIKLNIIVIVKLNFVLQRSFLPQIQYLLYPVINTHE